MEWNGITNTYDFELTSNEILQDHPRLALALAGFPCKYSYDKYS